jgi:tRNA U34 5-methylaminomethyl-2-thiouridine-forming methyltransferase MnmC
MNIPEIEIRITADGSTTLYRLDIDETYHSSHGALQEARHVFIQHGLAEYMKMGKVKILEIGFGTGLNALLTALFALDNKINIEYHGLEAIPLGDNILSQLNYAKAVDDDRAPKLLEKMYRINWDELVVLNEYFSLKKIHDTLQNFKAPQTYYDLIYFDAFGPRAQAEMWQRDLFGKLFQSLKSGGILTTYCAKGSFKRDLKSIGFQVEALPGPPGKREMTRARKTE